MNAHGTSLASVVSSAAERFGLKIRFDTHFEAQNYELSWWAGRSLHRLDFQTSGALGVLATHYEDRFRVFPRLFHWARSAIPYFPYLARIERKRSIALSNPLVEKDVVEFVATAISEG